MDYSWSNDDLWQIRITQQDFIDFEQPYIGNGVFGTRFDKLVMGTDKKPLCTLSRAVYDGGKQLLLPAWNHVFFEIGGITYTPDSGKHRLEQVLDLRNAKVAMADRWEYRPGKAVIVSVEMFIPRTLGHVGYLSLSVERMEEAATLRFGILGDTLKGYKRMDFSSEGDSAVTGEYGTEKQNRTFAQATAWKSSGLRSFEAGAANRRIEVTAAADGEKMRLELFHVVQSYEESETPRSSAAGKAKRLRTLGRDALLNTSSAEWKRLWKTGLAFETDDRRIAKSLLTHQFYLLCSLEAVSLPLGPLGLSKNGWGGTQFWDADFWIFRAVLPLWSDLARSIVDFRAKTLDRAKALARAMGCEGAWYPWMADEAGANGTPVRYSDELHVNIWIALAAWEYFSAFKDGRYLRETAWPILSGIADFFASRLETGRDGKMHLNCVVGPDESVCESEREQYRVGDDFLTNFGVRRVMEAACAAAESLGISPAACWKGAAERIFLPQPDANGIFPEYRGYSGHRIKQADVILAFYPLGFEADPEVIVNNVRYYHEKTDANGPLMTSQIESCILMRLGEKEAGLKSLFTGMDEFIRGPHFMPFECRNSDNGNSIMLTGIGGELQALIYGYYEADAGNYGRIPRVAQNTDD